MLWAPFLLLCLRVTGVRGKFMGSISPTVFESDLLRGDVMGSISPTVFKSELGER